MHFRFPPVAADPNDPGFLALDMTTYAKYKQVNRSGTRNVFLTGHTLVFTSSASIDPRGKMPICGVSSVHSTARL